MRVRTGVIGVGHLGRHHLRWLHEIPESDLVGLHDIDEAKACRYANEYGVTAFASAEELAAAVDAASVVVPTTAHFEVASTLIERGVHCLIEKPLVADLDQAGQLQMLADRAAVRVSVGHIERFNPAVLALREVSLSPAFIEGHRLTPFQPRGTDVAVVLDLMIHDIDLVLSFINVPIADIQASAVAVVSEQADIANARLIFENGAVANLTASRISLKEMRKLRLFQKSGYYSLDLAKKQADLYSLGPGTEPADGMRLPLGNSGKEILYQRRADSGQDMLRAELRAFLDAIAHDRPVAVSLSEATEALRVALQIERIGRESLDRMMERH